MSMAKKDEEQAKIDTSMANSSVRTEEVVVDCNHDHALALLLQEQEQEQAQEQEQQHEGDLTMLEASQHDETEDDEEVEEEGEDEDEESYLSSSATDSDAGVFFTSQELAELEILDQEEQVDMELEEEIVEDEEGEEDDIDPDELSYEDLVALGENVGQENQGLKLEEISSVLTPYICKTNHSNVGIDRCVICQSEYEEGEDLVALRCDHPFHGDCIKPWLQIKKTCPICSHEANKQKAE